MERGNYLKIERLVHVLSQGNMNCREELDVLLSDEPLRSVCPGQKPGLTGKSQPHHKTKNIPNEKGKKEYATTRF